MNGYPYRTTIEGPAARLAQKIVVPTFSGKELEEVQDDLREIDFGIHSGFAARMLPEELAKVIRDLQEFRDKVIEPASESPKWVLGVVGGVFTLFVGPILVQMHSPGVVIAVAAGTAPFVFGGVALAFRARKFRRIGVRLDEVIGTLHDISLEMTRPPPRLSLEAKQNSDGTVTADMSIRGGAGPAPSNFERSRVDTSSDIRRSARSEAEGLHEVEIDRSIDPSKLKK